MKAEIHPEYQEATVKCVCGSTWQTRSTVGDIHVDICSACHPFFTGKQKLVDTAGRVERFRRRYAKIDAKKGAEAAGAAAKATEETKVGAPPAAEAPAPAAKPKAEAKPKPKPKPEAKPKPKPKTKPEAEAAPTAASPDEVDTVEMEAPAEDASKDN